MSRRIGFFGVLSLTVLAGCGSAESGSGDLSFKGRGESSPVDSVDQSAGTDADGFDEPIEQFVEGSSMFPDFTQQGPMQLWSVHPDGTELRQLTENVGVDSTDPRLSPDGELIAYIAFDYESREPSRPELWVMDVDGSNARRLALNDLMLVWSSISWSPDSTAIRFVAREKSDSGLWSIDVRTGAIAAVPIEMDELSPPAWSPDGRRVAYVDTIESEDRNWSYWDLWIADVDGSNTQRVTDFDLDSISEPSWLLDGSGIVFSGFVSGFSARSISNLWVVNLDNGRIRRITGSQPPGGRWRASPDGKFVAYESYEGPCSVIVVPVDEGTERCALSFFAPLNFTWSPDSSRLAFLAEGFDPDPMDDANGDMTPPMMGVALWTIALDGSDARQVTQGDSANLAMGYSGMGYHDLVWRGTSDGEVIVFSMNE